MSPASQVLAFDIPVLLIQEAESHSVTVEMVDGTVYRGRLETASESMNMRLSRVVVSGGPDEQRKRLDEAMLRGSQVRFIVLPEILEDAPHFEQLRAVKASRAEKRHQRAGREVTKPADAARPIKKVKRTKSFVG